MDPFNIIDQSLRLLVLVSLDSREDARRLSHASPIMFRQYAESQDGIICAYVRKDLDTDDLIQDAMAVIGFPMHSRGFVLKDHLNHGELKQLKRMDDYLDAWGYKCLPNPFQPLQVCMPAVLCLQELCRQLRRYIEDYLSKAQSGYLPRAYRLIPSWAHSDFTSSTVQRELQAETRGLSLASLTPRERRRIFSAFLRYELLCKVYGPITAPKSSKDGLGVLEMDPCSSSWVIGGIDRTECWDWWLLHHYEGRKVFADAHWKSYWDPSKADEEAEFCELKDFTYAHKDMDLQLLPCVRKYVLCLYGALIADQVSAPVPHLPAAETRSYENAPEVGMRGFPDFNASAEWEESLHLGGEGWSLKTVSLMATAGFDLLNALLTSDKEKLRRFLVVFNLVAQELPPPQATNVCLPQHGPLEHQAGWFCHDFVRLNRQRAWALWDDPSNLLPSREQYDPSELPPDFPAGPGMLLETNDTRNELICYYDGARVRCLADIMTPFYLASKSSGTTR